MPITITLTDDQALEIVAQLGTMLKKADPNAPTQQDAKATFFKRVEAMKKGDMLSTTNIVIEYKLKDSMAQSWLNTCKKNGWLKMLKRGTYVRL